MEVTCPKCGKESSSYQGYAVHHSRSGHDGIPLVDLVGQGVLMDLYWSKGYEEIANELDVGSTTVQNVYDELDAPPKIEANRLEYQYGVPLPWILDTLHNTLEKSVNQMSGELGVSRIWIDRQMLDHDIPKRGRSEAEQLKWEQMAEGERESQVRAAHEVVREKYENGEGALQKWHRENPKRAKEHAKRVAGLGAAAREENGMAGVTGQDHPSWRGGKSVYDAVKKLLGDESWTTTRNRIRERAGGECEMCGRSATEIEHRDLDVHHIVPLLCGGTNGDWNLMALCDSCHHRAEWHTRELLTPVLTA